MDAVELDAILESMANEGLVVDVRYGGETWYLLMPFVVPGLKHPLRVLYGRLSRRV